MHADKSPRQLEPLFRLEKPKINSYSVKNRESDAALIIDELIHDGHLSKKTKENNPIIFNGANSLLFATIGLNNEIISKLFDRVHMEFRKTFK